MKEDEALEDITLADPVWFVPSFAVDLVHDSNAGDVDDCEGER